MRSLFSYQKDQFAKEYSGAGAEIPDRAYGLSGKRMKQFLRMIEKRIASHTPLDRFLKLRSRIPDLIPEKEDPE